MGKRKGGNHDNGWESVYLCFVACSGKCGCIFVNFVGRTTLWCENRSVLVSARRTQKSGHKTVMEGLAYSKKRCIWHFGCDGGKQNVYSPLSKGVAKAKTRDHKKRLKIARASRTLWCRDTRRSDSDCARSRAKNKPHHHRENTFTTRPAHAPVRGRTHATCARVQFAMPITMIFTLGRSLWLQRHDLLTKE